MANDFKRLLLKISGEALAGKSGTGYDRDIVKDVARQIASLNGQGYEICLVIGGGNFWRGRQGLNMNRSTADYMGMLATVMNALCVSEALEEAGVSTLVQSSVAMLPIAPLFNRKEADEALKQGKVVLFAGGTGHPYFSTDTTASLRAAEMDVKLLLCAKNIDGVYDSDPKINPEAKKYDVISYMDFIRQGLKAMDTTSVTMCMENGVPIFVFALNEKDSLINAVTDKDYPGTWIK